MEAKEFAKQFLERRAKQKQNQKRQQEQLSKEVAGLTMNNFPLQDSMRGVNPSALQSMFQAAHMAKGGMYDAQGGMKKKKQPVMLQSDPSILGKTCPPQLIHTYDLLHTCYKRITSQCITSV
ncbi:unnamed protein product [Oncorhynchus mykiss]|uniref:Uncharacterized protein n=3 Tax=Oncorhynchus TaxID=8016 RepID=A0A060Y8K2_ONCMY|nr:unnamed protein product [Oncorhynchus mykiss]